MNRKEAFKKLAEVIENHGSDDYENLGSQFMYEDISENIFEGIEHEELFKGMIQERQHGGEGQGEDYYVVWYFPKVDVYIKFYGYYQSYDGSEYEGFEHVEPEEVLITIYSPYKNQD